jgi:hypothetical protein
MAEPKFPKGSLVKVNNRDIRGLTWYPKLEQFHEKVGTVTEFEFWNTYFLPGEDHPTDVYNYTVDFGSTIQENIPQSTLKAADKK